MDENSVGRMCARSCRAVRYWPVLVLSSCVMLCSSLLWSISTTILWGLTNRLSWTTLSCSLAIAIVPILAVISPLAHWYLIHRTGKSASITSSFHAQWRQSVLSFFAGISVVFVECFVAICLSIWLRLTTIPGLGAILYLVGSWVDRFVSLSMISFLLVYLVFAAPLAVLAVRIHGKDLSEIFELFSTVTHDWVIRCKLWLLGIAPLLLFCLFSMMGGQELSRPLALELAAACVRSVIFAVAAAPLLLFFVFMNVEADRYVRWRQSR